MEDTQTKPPFIIKGRQIDLPFSVTIKSKESLFQVTAEKALRIAPNKRIVCSGTWGEKQVVIKFFLKCPKARRYFQSELNGIKALVSSGVTTPKIIFHGKVENSEIRAIGIEEISDSSDMMSVWESIEQESDYAGFQKKIIHEIAALHSAGLKQDDLHLGNFLFSKNKIFTIDGDSVDTSKMGQPLPEKESFENLVLFFSQFYQKFDILTEKSLEYYMQCRGLPSYPQLFSQIYPRIQQKRIKRQKKYLRKIFRECSEFVFKKERGIRFSCDRKAFGAGVSLFIENPDFFIQKGEIIKAGKTYTIVKININRTLYMVKFYNNKTVFQSSARISWRNAHGAKQKGIKLFRPILFMEQYISIFCLQAFFIVEYTKEYKNNSYCELFLKLENKNLNLEQKGL